MHTIKTLIPTFALALVVLFLPRPAGAQTFETVFSDNQGSSSRGTLVQGSDGNFYGTTSSSGAK